MDKRIQRTKSAVFNAVLELMLEKDPNKITVLELCKKADINKSTFYLHYSSINDCLKKCFAAVMNGVVEISKNVEYNEIKRNPKPFIDAYIDEVIRNADYLYRFKSSDICSTSVRILSEILVKYISQHNNFTKEKNYYEIANIAFGVSGILGATIEMLPIIDKSALSRSICTMIKSSDIILRT